MCAAAKVDIPNTIARVDQTLHSLVSEMATVTKMDIMKIFAQTRDGEDGGICNISALG